MPVDPYYATSRVGPVSRICWLITTRLPVSIWSGRRNHAFGIPEKRETTKRQGHFGDDHLRMIDLNLFRVLNAMMELRSVGVLPTPELARKISYPSCRSVFATRLHGL